MTTFRLGLIARIALLVVGIEITAFSALGWFYIDRFSTAAEQRLRWRLHLVAQMIASDELAVSTLSRQALVSDLLGAPCLKGMAIGGSGRVIVSTDPAHLGRTTDSIPGLDARRVAASAPDEQIVADGNTLTSIAHIHDATGQPPVYTTIITVSTTELTAQKHAIALRGQLGAGLFILLTSAAIILFAQRFVARRVDTSLAVLKDVEKGALDARIPISSQDELGQLQRGINSVIAKVESLLTEVHNLNRDLEQRVETRTAELEAANRELEAFAYSVSHDLRAPLRAIDGFSRILLEDHQASLDSEAQRLLANVRKATVKLGQLIDDILDFSRMGRREMEIGAIDIGQLARLAFEELRTEATGRNLRLVLHEMPPAWGDRAMIRQVLTNLLANAVKFTRTREDAVIEVGGQAVDEENLYFVKDNGVGFDMQYVGRLFGVFQRLHTTEEFEGTGIGLAIVKRIIARHGGRVWAEGRVDAGATIHFTLPRKEPVVDNAG